MRRLGLAFALTVAGVLLAGCGDDDAAEADAVGDGEGVEQPTVVATTSILGDVLESFAGGQLAVITIMPVGADPHDFQASAQQANQMREADALIVNGAGFEVGLLDAIEAATGDGTPTFEAISAVDPIALGGGGDDHADGDDHDPEGQDPHFFTDPARMAASVDAMAGFLVDNLDGIDAEVLRSSADDYIAALEALDADVEATLAAVPPEQRVLVTGHGVFGYFADRYGFDVVGTVIPSGSTTDGASAGALADLAELIEDEGAPAIFADASSSRELSDTLADEVGGITVVELFSESLGEPGSGGATYLDMIRTNAERIADALA